MKQLTVNIPDSYLPAFIEYFNNIPQASVLNESDFIITSEILATLDKSSAIDNSQYYTVEESNKLLRAKHGI
jgi:hypothetical protein